MTEKSGSEECYGVVDGKKDDAFIHDPIADSRAAREELAELNVKLAVELGVDPDTARAVYGS